MPFKKHKTEEIIGKLGEAEIVIGPRGIDRRGVSPAGSDLRL